MQRGQEQDENDAPAQCGHNGEADDDHPGDEREQDRAEQPSAYAQPPHHAFPHGALEG
jgi:hypothetical protein